MSIKPELFEAIEYEVTEDLGKLADHDKRQDYLTRQRNDLNKAMREFRKYPSASNWNKFELCMAFFQQTFFAFHRSMRIERDTLIGDSRFENGKLRKI